MPVPIQTEARISLIGVLRCVGICVAITELIYLLGWVVLTLPLAAVARRFAALSGLSDLGVGMLWAAVFGTVVGLMTTLTFNLIGWRAYARARSRI
ncbi:MAG: hypothetical protein K9G59_09565 [Caulobacter sp.]|nr:hypothetical protein [Caulobacter sp.]